MNIIQKIGGSIFPPYRYSIIRKGQRQLFNAIINSLPDEFYELKGHLAWAMLMDLSYWVLFPEYRFVSSAYAGESIFKSKKRGKNYKISGLSILSKKTGNREQIELLVHDNLVEGLHISNSNYDISEFDLSKIDSSKAVKSDFKFPSTVIDKFYEKLPREIKEKLDPDNLGEIDLADRTYYSFYDLEDGNYLAIDKKQNVYSLVHDARPIVKKMNISFQSILDEISNGTFNAEEHLDERYREKH